MTQDTPCPRRSKFQTAFFKGDALNDEERTHMMCCDYCRLEAEKGARDRKRSHRHAFMEDDTECVHIPL